MSADAVWPLAYRVHSMIESAKVLTVSLDEPLAPIEVEQRHGHVLLVVTLGGGALAAVVTLLPPPPPHPASASSPMTSAALDRMALTRLQDHDVAALALHV